MGNWNISIRGIGPHNNGQSFDGDSLAADFVKLLREKGHHVAGATFITGAEYSLEKPHQHQANEAQYAAERQIEREKKWAAELTGGTGSAPRDVGQCSAPLTPVGAQGPKAS